MPEVRRVAVLGCGLMGSGIAEISALEQRRRCEPCFAELFEHDLGDAVERVDADEVAAMVLTTHILPDIMGNMRSYSSQTLRCTTCGAKFRRMPLIGKCSECGSELIQTVTRGAVEKYLGIATGMCAEYKINEYLKSRVDSLSMELKLIFKEQKKTQSSMMEFIDS